MPVKVSVVIGNNPAKVAEQIHYLNFLLREEHYRREEALKAHGEANDVFFAKLDTLMAKVKAFFEARAGRKAVKLHKAAHVSKLALKSVQ